MSPADQSQRQVLGERVCSTSPVHSQGSWRPRWVLRAEEKIWGVATATASLMSGYARAARSLNPKPSFKLAPEHTMQPLETCNVLLSIYKALFVKWLVALPCQNSILQCSPAPV